MPLQQLLDVPAPAKLNLFLHVVGRRDDGYHLLQSVFTLIDWADTLHFDRRPDGRISREDLGNGPPLPSDDLTVRAARLLQQHTGCSLGVHIGLQKAIPSQAGLGGGSSDAATTLLALNRLWQLGLSREALSTLGLKLGADVPFFIGGQHAWVEGIGESLTPMSLPPARYLVLKPPTGLSTPAIFQHPELKRDSRRAIIEDFVANGRLGDQMFGINDLQAVACKLCPDVALGLEWFRRNGMDGRMTGSGSALFAPVSGDVDTTTLPPDWISRHCNNLRVHPLFEWR